jgi:hypothetical protein
MRFSLPIYYNPLTGYLHELRETRQFLFWERHTFGSGCKFFSDAHTTKLNNMPELSSADSIFKQLIRVDIEPDNFWFLELHNQGHTYQLVDEVYEMADKNTWWSWTPQRWNQYSS